MTQSLPSGLTDCFLWSPEKGQGFHTRPAMLYGGDYFAHYQKLDATKMGGLLTKARVELVKKYVSPAEVVDIGIGGGRFVQESQGMGYDVCPDAISWLQSIYAYRDPYGGEEVRAITCWDSLEHIPEPEKLLERVKEWLFVSIPLCETASEWVESKHMKPGEHLHYFSMPGFIRWCGLHGFECIEVNHAETELGREGIASFAFKRLS